MTQAVTLLDLLVLAVGALAGWSGWRTGGLTTLVGIVARVAGVAAGLWVAHLVAATSWPFVARIAVEVAVVLLGLVLGGRVARLLVPPPVRPSTPDRVLGVVVRAVTGTVLAAAVVAGLALWGPAEASATAGRSFAAVAAAPRVSALAGDLRATLPADLDGVVPAAADTPRTDIALDAEQAAATVQIVASTTGSTTTSVGSGFVVAGFRVVTAHHVVAGASEVDVVVGGQRFGAAVAVDDAGDDVTVLSVGGSGLAGVTPVVVSGARVSPGTAAVVAGYPGGGPLQATTATVVGGVVLPAVGDSGLHLRPAYRLAASVRPGNSGGPVFDGAGEVIGMVDARSLTADGVGFAITADPVLAALRA